MKKIKSICLFILRLALVFLSIVFFPFGLFLLGYIIGTRKNVKRITVSKENNAKLIENGIITEEKNESEDKIILD